MDFSHQTEHDRDSRFAHDENVWTESSSHDGTMVDDSAQYVS